MNNTDSSYIKAVCQTTVNQRSQIDQLTDEAICITRNFKHTIDSMCPHCTSVLKENIQRSSTQT